MSSILFEKIEHIGKITLNRPEVFNSFNREMALRLQEVLDDCLEEKEIRTIYLTGEGKAFCAGQDLKEITQEDGPPLDVIIKEHFNPIIERIRQIEKPIVCGVNGAAAGAGANLAIACDITVASSEAYFVQAFSKIGLIPDSGGTYFLPRLVGWQKATALMMLGEKIQAEEAAEMGMIYKVFPSRTFHEQALALVETLAQKPPYGLALTKRALNYSIHNDLEKQLAIEEQLQSAAGQSEDFKEGVRAFLEKRKPTFKGK